jgi:hypothetical protein
MNFRSPLTLALCVSLPPGALFLLLATQGCLSLPGAKRAGVSYP